MDKRLQKKRPVNLDLTTIKLPFTALTSITHRLSGLLLALLIPWALCTLQCSLQSPEHFNQISQQLSSPIVKLGVWVGVSALSYHLLAGLRHLIMDCGLGDTPQVAKQSAVIMVAIFVALALGMGVWLW